MDFDLHLMQREEAVVIFLDMDPSITRTDHALPYPLDAPNHVPGTSGGNSCPNGPAEGAGTLTANASAFVPPQTRLDVIRLALRSFILQKQRAASNAAASLWFSLYLVGNNVVEVLPPTRGDSAAIDAAVNRHIRETAEPAAWKTAPRKPFPFHAAAEMLRHTEEILLSRDNKLVAKRREGETSSTSTHNAVASASASASAAPQATKRRRLMLIQGLLLLNRDSDLPAAAMPSAVAAEETATTDLLVRRFLDIIPLGKLRRLPPAATRVRERRRGDGSASLAPHAGLGCPCNIVDPVRITGVPHRGLALGCALTRLLAPHVGESASLLSAQPLCRVNLALSSTNTQTREAHQPCPEEVSVQQGSPPQVQAGVEPPKQGISLGVKEKSPSPAVTPGAPLQRPSVGEAPCAASGTPLLMKGTVRPHQERAPVGKGSTTADSQNPPPLEGVVLGRVPRVQSPSSSRVHDAALNRRRREQRR
ncbi:uncharacterized protein Tco025E_02957 [Trypanosoma conorhini]|uniref:Uncharacterized protein n=1 Tax=Trypanosoma conorhini TaxID=83891 RepID=A0A3R7L8E1_9TRYP|nr:uncharacterized protein Tco025E_02957 [Trypanosoma conorhini]RNF23157.1 hypothetical protein Tco025E_02957 [Trypanosoma conorhini]